MGRENFVLLPVCDVDSFSFKLIILSFPLGPVLVTKNPCMHPGDFRRLNAVRNNLLESSMRDVIVFPTTGSRPHSNEISGSDLDGDQYWVYWGTDLTIANLEEPLSYKGADKEPAPVINQETIVNHIVDTFGAGGIIGIIANTHTVIADKSKKHSLDPDCKYLAEMFARAVDAPKTGEKIPIGPVRTLQKKWCRDSPQFMQKFSEQQYESTSISEKLFLIAKEVYFQGKETPMLLPLPQLPRKAKQASPLYIADKTFAKWLKLTNIQEDTSRY
jgi:RNA-dependent RNA polymerase